MYKKLPSAKSIFIVILLFSSLITNAQQPSITGFSPAATCPGSTVTITGTNFTGVTAVNFGSTPAASFIVNSSTTISAVPIAGASGTISVVTTSGTATSASTITIGGSSATYAYMANWGSNTVSVINSATNTITATIPVQDEPGGVSISPDGNTVYVANQGSNTVSVISTASNTVTATIPVGSLPEGMRVTPDGSRLYVSNITGNNISVINTATNSVIATIPVGYNPGNISITPDGSTVYVTNFGGANVNIISTATNTVIATIPVGTEPNGMDISPDGSKLYVANFGDDNVSVISTATNSVTATVNIGTYPHGVSVTPDGSKVYVVNQGDGTVSVIDASNNTVITTVGVGDGPTGICVSPDGTEAYVSNFSDGTVNVINTSANTVEATIAVGTEPNSYGNFIATVTTPCSLPATTFIWVGTYNTYWFDPGNWNMDQVPDITDSVLIPFVTTHMPLINSSAGVKEITINSGASLTINDTLKITGAFNNNGSLNAGAGVVELVGSSNQSFLGNNGTIGSFIIDNPSGATVGSTVNITGSVSFGNVTNAALASNGYLVIKSSQLGTASIAQLINGNSITGSVTVERYIPANSERAWRLLSVPTTGQTINEAWQEGQTGGSNTVPGYGTIITASTANSNWAADGFDYQQVQSSIQTYNQSTNSWNEVPSTFNALATTAGYFLYIRGDRSEDPAPIAGPTTATTLRTKGNIYQGTQPAITVPSNSFGLIGNIYASTIDFTGLSLTGNIDNQFYLWDPKLLNQPPSLGMYVTFSSANNWVPVPGIAGVGSFGNTANSLIQSGQAFFVHATSGAGSITLNENSKVLENADVFRPAMPLGTSEKLTTNLYRVSDTAIQLADGNVEVFNSAYSDTVDGNDALKLSNTEENFTIIRDKKVLVIEARQPVANTDTIFFDMWNMQQQQYKLEFTPSGLNIGNLSAYLQDKYLGTSTPINLSITNNVLFTVDNNAGSSASNRFRIVFNSTTPVPVTFTGITATAKGATKVEVDWAVTKESGMLSYTIERSTDGTNFTPIATVPAKSTNSGSDNYNWTDASAITGTDYYRVKGIGSDGTITYTSIAKVLTGEITPAIAVYPNPISDGHLTIELINQPAGAYAIRLLDVAGQVVYATSLSHPGGSKKNGLNISGALAAGVYKLELVSPVKQVYTSEVIIK